MAFLRVENRTRDFQFIYFYFLQDPSQSSRLLRSPSLLCCSRSLLRTRLSRQSKVVVIEEKSQNSSRWKVQIFRPDFFGGFLRLLLFRNRATDADADADAAHKRSCQKILPTGLSIGTHPIKFGATQVFEYPIAIMLELPGAYPIKHLLVKIPPILHVNPMSKVNL